MRRDQTPSTADKRAQQSSFSRQFKAQRLSARPVRTARSQLWQVEANNRPVFPELFFQQPHCMGVSHVPFPHQRAPPNPGNCLRGWGGRLRCAALTGVCAGRRLKGRQRLAESCDYLRQLGVEIAHGRLVVFGSFSEWLVTLHASSFLEQLGVATFERYFPRGPHHAVRMTSRGGKKFDLQSTINRMPQIYLYFMLRSPF